MVTISPCELQFAKWLYEEASPGDGHYVDFTAPFDEQHWDSIRKVRDGKPINVTDLRNIQQMATATHRMPVELRIILTLKGWLP